MKLVQFLTGFVFCLYALLLLLRQILQVIVAKTKIKIKKKKKERKKRKEKKKVFCEYISEMKTPLSVTLKGLSNKRKLFFTS